MKKKEDLGICKDCNKHKATVKFSDEPMFALTHGFGVQYLCQCCYVKRIRDEYKNIGRNLKTQEKKLKKAGCEKVSR